MRSAKVEFKEDWIMIPTSELGRDFKIGRIMEAWTNTVKVCWVNRDGKEFIGIYTILKHQFLIPTLSDWFEYYEISH